MVNNIHKSAIIDDNVVIGENVTIGPYCYITGNVEIGNNNILKSHVVISGNTKIANNNVFHSFSNIGDAPQDLKFSGEDSYLEIGSSNVFRENVTIHSGTAVGNKYHNIHNLTKIGDECLFMVGSHVAHDCVVENKVIMANNATLAGHVSVGHNVIIGGLSAVLQFVRIGDFAIIGGMSGIDNDVLPYALVTGDRAFIAGLNLIGLKRNGFDKNRISTIKSAYNFLFEDSSYNLKEKVNMLKEQNADNESIKLLVDFISNSGQKALLKPRSK
ncbi:MAG: acyl-ACP--UDP-N-acetylglucosamine O-acyltransferase [Alphaproteobacteria bacterium]|jgi:UDP-N-acetylglucosamine acyltransferase|nr:acyl-ACP--UDP-N-acetylglucosamine O-acyltransferase [Alphaproteobacteria bacterium]MBT5827393.1 acyl-ACP--UDP-N-acetylglucosamine O-acyltransferase [Alphaproteobacteria bacterium]